jgi:hypothetical protein
MQFLIDKLINVIKELFGSFAAKTDIDMANKKIRELESRISTLQSTVIELEKNFKALQDKIIAQESNYMLLLADYNVRRNPLDAFGVDTGKYSPEIMQRLFKRGISLIKEAVDAPHSKCYLLKGSDGVPIEVEAQYCAEIAQILIQESIVDKDLQTVANDIITALPSANENIVQEWLAVKQHTKINDFEEANIVELFQYFFRNYKESAKEIKIYFDDTLLNNPYNKHNAELYPAYDADRNACVSLITFPTYWQNGKVDIKPCVFTAPRNQ